MSIEKVKEELTLKRFLGLLLCLATLISVFVGCTGGVQDTGAITTIYMDYTTNFDPALAYNDTAASQFLSLVYQGLVTVDDNGKLKKSLATGWKLKDDNILEISLGESYWNDGTAVSASDFIFAWKRILDPEFDCDAASLLFGIKNAVEAKNGNCSIEDLKAYASGTNTITVELIDGYNYETFLYNCASVALLPLRNDVVNKIAEDVNELPLKPGESYYNDVEHGWSTLAAVMNNNGPFYVKKFDLFGSAATEESDASAAVITLERNKYYYRPADSDTKETKYVTPYRLNVVVLKPGEDISDGLKKYNDGSCFYISHFDVDDLGKLSEKDVKVNDAMATYSYYFNTENDLFKDAKVRTALSMAIDRKEVVDNIVHYGTPAEGLISTGVFNTTRKTSFAEERTSKLKTTADVEGAKALLKEAGVTSGSFTITVRDSVVDVAVAEYAKAQWEKLGFKVEVKALGYKGYSYYEQTGFETNDAGERDGYKIEPVYSNLVKDEYNNALKAGDFDVIGIDFNMLSTDAFAALAMFGTTYSGGAYDLSVTADTFEEIPHVTGYVSDEYTSIITAALYLDADSYNAMPDSVKKSVGADAKKIKSMDADELAELKAAILHAAEDYLMGDMPVLPVYYMQNVYMVNKKFTGIKVDYYGHANFTKAKNKTYKGGAAAEAYVPTKSWDLF